MRPAVCAVLAAFSAVLHLTMLGHASNAVVAVLIVAMALTRLFCGYELRRAGSLRIWCPVGVVSLGMVAAHLSLPDHRHGEQPAFLGPPAESMSVVMGLDTTVALAEPVVAVAVLWVVSRCRSVGLGITDKGTARAATS